MPPAPAGVRRPRILLLRPDHLGDVLLTLPAAVALRRSVPEAHLAYAVAPAMATVPRHCPAVDEVHPVPFPPPDAVTSPAGWDGAVQAAAARLRGGFDVALVLRPDDPWSARLAAAAGIPVRIGLDQPRTRPFLTRTLPSPAGRHAVTMGHDLAAAALRPIGVPLVAPVTERCFVPTEDEEAAIRKLLAADAGRPPVVLHPASGWPLKSWPARRWAELAGWLHARTGTRPLVVGTTADRQVVATVVSAAAGAAAGLVDRLSVGELAALHRRALLVVGIDSGALHLAAMMGAPVVALFGPADPRVFAPAYGLGSRYIVVDAPLPCSPCGTLVDPPCGAVTAPACLAGITVAAVQAAAAELLSDARADAASRRVPKVRAL